MKNRSYYRLLTIAGSDCSGGAGIQADLKTFAAMGCYGMSVITALTAQNTVAVEAVQVIPADFVGKQLDAVLDDIGVDAVKTGMLCNAEIIQIIAKRLKTNGITRIVVDPVMVSKSGVKLLSDEAVNSLKSNLLPLAALVTPNIPEAELLAGQPIKDRSTTEVAGKKIASFGAQAVLIKGGHSRENGSDDCLCITGNDGKTVTHWFEGDRINTNNTHGTGCTLASAIAANLAKSLDIKEAVQASKKYLEEALRKGSEYRLGKGTGPVHHFHSIWR